VGGLLRGARWCRGTARGLAEVGEGGHRYAGWKGRRTSCRGYSRRGLKIEDGVQVEGRRPGRVHVEGVQFDGGEGY
jgi:hypothetical protein